MLSNIMLEYWFDTDLEERVPPIDLPTLLPAAYTIGALQMFPFHIVTSILILRQDPLMWNSALYPS